MSSSLQSPEIQGDIWKKLEEFSTSAHQSFTKTCTPTSWKNVGFYRKDTNKALALGQYVVEKQTLTRRTETVDRSKISRINTLQPLPKSIPERQSDKTVVYNGEPEFQSSYRKGSGLKSVFQETAVESLPSQNEDASFRLENCSEKSKPIIDLSEAKCYHKKPPIVSPKHIAPSLVTDRARLSEHQAKNTLSELESQPILRSCGNSSPQGLTVYKDIPTIPQADAKKRSSTTPLLAKNFQSNIKETLTRRQKFGIKIQQEKNSTKRCQTLPRQTFWDKACEKSPSKASHAMDSQMFQYSPKSPEAGAEKHSLKKPPKIAAKPSKLKASFLAANESENVGKFPSRNRGFFPKENEDYDPCLMPISDIRSKFEDMKIKFKKPVPDPTFKPTSTNGVKENTTCFSTSARDLFKDILDMSNIDSTSENIRKVNNENCTNIGNQTPSTNLNAQTPSNYNTTNGQQSRSSASVNLNRSDLTCLSEERVVAKGQQLEPTVHTQSIKELKEKYKDECATKAITSLVSSSNKAPFSASQNQHVATKSQQASFDDALINTLDIPAPSKGIANDVNEINFMDLPPPPDLPPVCDPPQNTKLYPPVTAQLPRNANDDKEIKLLGAKPGFCQIDNHSFAPGFSEATQPSLTASSDKQDSADNTCQSYLDGRLSTNYSYNPVQSCASTRSESAPTKCNSNQALTEKLNSISKRVSTENCEGNFAALALPDSKQHDVKRARSFDEEILYYDNMDIMEKVMQKREQEEFVKQNKPKQKPKSDKNVSFPKSNQNSQSSRNESPNIALASNAQNTKENFSAAAPSSRLTAEADSETEFRTALGDLEYEYLKLKANLDQESGMQNPPKLPPKQLKFNRQQATQSAENQSSPVTETQPSSFEDCQQRNSSDTNSQLRSDITAPPLQTKLHIPSSMPLVNTSPLNAQPQSQAAISGQGIAPVNSQQQQVLARQLSPEDARARQLVDEPLAPIIEEDSTFGDSSSCSSSVSGDDASLFADEYSVHSSHKPCKRRDSPLDSAWSSSLNSSRRNLDEDSELDHTDGEVTETESQFPLKFSKSRQSSSSTEEASDASSVRWQENPVQGILEDKGSTSVFQHEFTSPSFPNSHSIKKSSTGNSDGIYEFQTDDDNLSVHSLGNVKRETSRDSRCSESSGAKSSDSSNVSKLNKHRVFEEGVEDVEPYGMVDLSKLQPTFEEARFSGSRPTSRYSESELTPSSIMYNVSQFNAAVNSQPKTPTKSRTFSFNGDGEVSELPNFPLNVQLNKNQAKNTREKITPSAHQQPRKSDASIDFQIEHEEVGYDNLENYGGSARTVAEKNKLREASLSAKYVQSVPKDENEEASFDGTKRGRLERNVNSKSRDSLSSEPGGAGKPPESHASFPLPVPGSRLAQHSSAVRAVDRHSGNLKRAKETARLEALTKSPASRRLNKLLQRSQPNQSSTLPRANSQDADTVFEDKPTVKHSRSTESFKIHQICVESPREVKDSARITDNKERSRTVHATATSSNTSPEKKIPLNKTNSNSSLTESKPFPLSEYEESMDDGNVNPYEEVPFVLVASSNLNFVDKPAPESEEQIEAKTRVQEILENIKPPESLYKPKLPLPRYPVDYDNFYLGKTEKAKEYQYRTAVADNIPVSTTATNKKPPEPSSLPLLPLLDDKASVYSDILDTPMSTPGPVRSRTFSSKNKTSFASPDDNTPTDYTGQNQEEAQGLTEPEDSHFKSSDVWQSEPETRRRSSDASIGGSSYNSSDSNTNRSLGSQLRSLLGGSPESKYISPSLRRKRSLLKRSKSPGGSRRSKTPPRSKSPSQQSVDGKISSESSVRSPVETSSENIAKTDYLKVSESESHDRVPPRRSASQRLVDRRGRSQRSKNVEDNSSEATFEGKKKDLDKAKMTSKWRRSKSQDRQSPTRSKSKERKVFGRRSKSQERPESKSYEAKDIDIGEKGPEGRGFLRRHRSSSRKRSDKREKSSDRANDANSSGARGRNPVKFFRKLLRSRKGSDDDEKQIVPVSLGKGGEMSDSTEALTTILAYKGDEVSKKEEWNPPRPNPPQQKITSVEKQPPSVPAKSNKAMRSPPSHRAKKMSSVLASSRPRGDPSTESSSEGDRKKPERTRALDTYGLNRTFLAPPPKPNRPSSRKNSFSNSIPSSDSEQLNKSLDSRKEGVGSTGLKSQFRAARDKKLKKVGRKNLLLNRDYDSDTATSVLPSDADSSTGIQSDAENANSSIRSAMKGSARSRFKGSSPGAPKRPVRVISPQRSKSDPTIFAEDFHKNTYYNIEESDYQKSSTPAPEAKSSSKLAPHRRKNQKQTRRQTAPVDLAYETHQRQKYKTLVSLNAQTLRKVTERWLSEWRNQLPVGGFLITSWSDVALASHRPLCMIGSSIIYSAVSTGNKSFNLACQLYDQLEIDDRMFRRLDNYASLPAHPNVCGVCSHFTCRVPRSILDPNSGGGAADAVCVVLTNRPCQSLQEFLDRVVLQEEPTEYHRQLLINILQLLHGVKHLRSSGFDLSSVSIDNLIITENRGFLQILPHLAYSESTAKKGHNVDRLLDSYQTSAYDSTDNSSGKHLSVIQQIGRLMRKLLQNGHLVTTTGGLGPPGDRSSAASSASRVVVPGTKYSTAIKHLINFLEQSPAVVIKEAKDVVQCALWGPEDLDDVGVDDVSPYSALELWIEMEQAKLVNNLAVLTPSDRLVPLSFLKHQYFASVTPDELFNGLKVLQRL